MDVFKYLPIPKITFVAHQGTEVEVLAVPSFFYSVDADTTVAVLLCYSLCMTLAIVIQTWHRSWPLSASDVLLLDRWDTSTLFVEALKGSLVDPIDNRLSQGGAVPPPHPQCYHLNRATTVTDHHTGKNQIEFVEYCPAIFGRLRALHGITLRCISTSFNQGSPGLFKGEGKSGSDFMKSADGKYCLKTVSQPELQVLLKILPLYYGHMVKGVQASLLVRILGLFRLYNHRNTVERYFLLMINISAPICGKKLVHTYDLKGSLYSRRVSMNTMKRATLKDLNWIEQKCSLHLTPAVAKTLAAQLKNDIAILAKSDIMDYSLFLCVYENTTSVTAPWKRIQGFMNGHRQSVQPRVVNSLDGSRSYAIGIIDILQSYTYGKSAENIIKSTRGSSMDVIRYFNKETTYVKTWVRGGSGLFSTSKLHSAIDPKQYSKRFLDFMQDHVLN